jgi:ubiquinone/menaquinone biosynthesis C-methylase UbiE
MSDNTPMAQKLPIVQKKFTKREFELMQGFYRFVDHVHPHVRMKAESFGVTPGQTVVDYGCGPGRYAVEFARLVGSEGKVIAVDLVEIALSETRKSMEGAGLTNYELVLAHEYDTGIADNTADKVCAIDMFHHVADTNAFLREVRRIAKSDALLIFSGGHMLRKHLKSKVAESGMWELTEERAEFIAYKAHVHAKTIHEHRHRHDDELLL